MQDPEYSRRMARVLGSLHPKLDDYDTMSALRVDAGSAEKFEDLTPENQKLTLEIEEWMASSGRD
jgi:hypothetical protein